MPEHTSSLQRLKNMACGKTAYVLGNAPSLSTLNLARLMERDSFWVNRAYEMERQNVPFRPKYYFVSDPAAIASHGPSCLAVHAGIKFFRSDAFQKAGRPAGTISVPFHKRPCMDQGYFSTDPSTGLYRGFTVVLDCIQMAFYMGYQQVLVGGVDLTYGYFYSDDRTQTNLPISRCINAFKVADAHFTAAGRQLAKITASPNLPLTYSAGEKI